MLTADELKAQGNKAFASGDHQTAINLFTQAIELDPTNHVLYSNRSASHSSLKNYDEALADAQKTIEIKADWPKGYSRKGAALYGMARYEEAKEAYQAGLEHDPSSALLKKGLSDAEAAMAEESGAGMGDFVKQMSDAFKGDVLGKLAANPNTASYLADPEFVRKIQDVQANPDNLQKYAGDQRMTMAMFTLMGMGDMFAQATAGASAAGSNDSPFSSGQQQKQSQQPAKEEQKKKEEPVAPEKEELTGEAKEAADAKALGNEAYKARKFEDALEHYNKAIELDSADITFYNNKAAVYFEMGKYPECIETAEKAFEVGREHRAEYKHIAKALGRIGTAYSKQDNLDKAIEYYNRSLSEHRAADVLNKLRALEKLRKDREIEAYLDDEKANEARERGNELFKTAKFAEAQAEYSEAIKRNPKDPRNFSNRAACLTKLMAIPDAIKDCETCIQLDPKFTKAYIRKANALFLMREYAEALDALDEAKTNDEEKKNTSEIDQLEYKCYNAINEHNSRVTPEEALKRAQANPRIASLLSNPVMQNILQQMQADPRAAREHLKNPAVASNLRKLIAAGIVRMG